MRELTSTWSLIIESSSIEQAGYEVVGTIVVGTPVVGAAVDIMPVSSQL
jgi:hypothetical protein